MTFVSGDPAVPTAADLAAFDEVVTATNDVLDQARTLRRLPVGAARAPTPATTGPPTLHSQLQAKLAGLQKLTARFEAWVARFGADALARASEVAADHAHALRQAVVSAGHLMSEAEESLYADLRLTGGSAWNKLHGDVTSLLGADVDGRRLPITVVRGMATNPDAGRARAGLPGRARAPGRAWRCRSPPPSTPSKVRPTPSTPAGVGRTRLAPALHANSVEPAALEAMQAAAVASFPDFRRFLLAKIAPARPRRRPAVVGSLRARPRRAGGQLVEPRPPRSSDAFGSYSAPAGRRWPTGP